MAYTQHTWTTGEVIKADNLNNMESGIKAATEKADTIDDVASDTLASAKEYANGLIPSTLPNPYALTLTGGATGTYDGSKAVSITIPEQTEVEVTQTLTSGTKIGSVNGTALYAPSSSSGGTTTVEAEVTQILKAGTAIATVNGTTLYAPEQTEVEVTQALTSGTKIGSVNGTALFAPEQTEVTVKQTLTSGTEIGSVNGTPLYAPETTASTTEDPLAGKVVTCFGDSLMTGGQSPSSDSVGFARIIKNKHPDATVYNYAVNGSVLSQAAYEINYENGVTRGKIADAINTVLGDTSTYPGGANPDYIVISGLGNDYLTCYNYGSNMQYLSDIFGTLNTGTWDYDSYETVFEALECMFATLINKFPFAKIVFIAPHGSQSENLGLFLYVINKAVAGICEKYGVTFFDMGQTMLGSSGTVAPYTTDGSLLADSLHPSEAGYDYIADEFDECLTTGISNNYYSRNYMEVPLTSAVTATSTYTAGYTYNNILFAYNLGSVIRVVDSAGIVFNMAYHDDSVFQFSSAVYNSKPYIIVLYISKSDNNKTFNAVVTTLGG